LVFDAKELSHPLLARKGRVANDLKLHHDSPMILLTGSNMSGKSTLLRTLGINAVLAYAGSMVCAKKLHLSEHLQVATSMRIKDSLEHGISFFMAELYRLKRILDMREKADPIFYLLDEMLHGTNTLERRIAALGIIAQLLDSPAIGAVSTHDMEVSEKCSRFAPRIRFAYLSDQITDRQMRFDYKLREGICPTTNALKLLEIVGIALPEEAKTW
jgi:DNA mismatch repair ATPase MutS